MTSREAARQAVINAATRLVDARRPDLTALRAAVADLRAAPGTSEGDEIARHLRTIDGLMSALRNMAQIIESVTGRKS